MRASELREVATLPTIKLRVTDWCCHPESSGALHNRSSAQRKTLMNGPVPVAGGYEMFREARRYPTAPSRTASTPEPRKVSNFAHRQATSNRLVLPPRAPEPRAVAAVKVQLCPPPNRNERICAGGYERLREAQKYRTARNPEPREFPILNRQTVIHGLAPVAMWISQSPEVFPQHESSGTSRDRETYV